MLLLLVLMLTIQVSVTLNLPQVRMRPCDHLSRVYLISRQLGFSPKQERIQRRKSRMRCLERKTAHHREILNLIIINVIIEVVEFFCFFYYDYDNDILKKMTFPLQSPFHQGEA